MYVTWDQPTMSFSKVKLQYTYIKLLFLFLLVNGHIQFHKNWIGWSVFQGPTLAISNQPWQRSALFASILQTANYLFWPQILISLHQLNSPYHPVSEEEITRHVQYGNMKRTRSYVLSYDITWVLPKIKWDNEVNS